MRSSLEGEAQSYKRDRKELEKQISQLKKEMEKVHVMLLKHAGHAGIDQLSDGLKNVNSEDGLVTKTRSFSDNENSSEAGADDKVIDPKDEKANKADLEESQLIQKLKLSSKSDDADDDHDYLTQKVKMLQIRLEDANKAIYDEKE